MITALCFDFVPCTASARSSSGSDRPPIARPPIFKKSRRFLPSQKPCCEEPWIESMRRSLISMRTNTAAFTYLLQPFHTAPRGRLMLTSDRSPSSLGRLSIWCWLWLHTGGEPVLADSVIAQSTGAIESITASGLVVRDSSLAVDASNFSDPLPSAPAAADFD